MSIIGGKGNRERQGKEILFNLGATVYTVTVGKINEEDLWKAHVGKDLKHRSCPLETCAVTNEGHPSFLGKEKYQSNFIEVNGGEGPGKVGRGSNM